MLQQTQVTTVIPYFHRFLEAFPTLQALATADEAEVLARWSGLGYYSRAKNLKRGAQFLVDKYGGQFPKTRPAILEVPGIGPYTAGAILSIAFDLKEPLVDGNVQRVFARFYGMDFPVNEKRAQNFFWEKAAEWVGHSESARVLNQALMELGATLCTKGTPRCPACPVRDGCVALRENRQLELPVKKTPREKVELHWLSVVLESRGQIFVHKNEPGEWWSDMWDFPRVQVDRPAELPKRVQELMRRFPKAELFKELGHQRHTVTHHKINVVPYLLRLPHPARVADRLEGYGKGEWVDVDELERRPVSSLVKKILSSREVR